MTSVSALKRNSPRRRSQIAWLVTRGVDPRRIAYLERNNLLLDAQLQFQMRGPMVRDLKAPVLPRPARLRCAGRQRGTGRRPAARRATRSTTSSSSDPGEPGEGEPPPAGRPPQHPLDHLTVVPRRRRAPSSASTPIAGGHSRPATISAPPPWRMRRGAENPSSRTPTAAAEVSR